MTMENIFTNSIDVSLSESIKNRVKAHKYNFNRLLISRYLELLPFLITYDTDINTIDFIQLELMLRYGKYAIVGETKNGDIKILGYTNFSYNDINDFNFTLANRRLIKDDIVFTIDKSQLLDDYIEIVNDDNCKTGNFIVIKNKIINYVNDISIVKHYAEELAEIALSRFSIILQMKINTFFVGDIGDETINQLVQDVYNGSPFVKVNKFFDKEDNIISISNNNMSQTLIELKREYQNKISELNTMLGIYNTAVDKESGISTQELNSSSGLTFSNSNIYLSSREKSFNKLNKRYNLNIKPKFNDLVNSEFMQLEKSDILNKDMNYDNNNNLQNYNK